MRIYGFTISGNEKIVDKQKMTNYFVIFFIDKSINIVYNCIQLYITYNEVVY